MYGNLNRRLGVASALLALSSLFLSSSVNAADAEARAVLEKAIKAHQGKPEILAKAWKGFGQVRSKGRNFPPTGMPEEIPFTKETSFTGDGRIRSVTRLDVNGVTVISITVVNGDDMWVNVNGMEIELDDKTKNDDKARRRGEDLKSQVGNLAFLLQQDGEEVTLSSLGESEVEGKTVVGVKVASRSQPNIGLYFDKGTGLLRKREETTDGGQLIETIFLEYKEFYGILQGAKILTNLDGELVAEEEVLEWKTVDKLDDDLFTKP